MQESIYWTWWLNTLLPRPTEAKKAAEKSFCPRPKQFHSLGSVHSASRHRAVRFDKHPSKSVLSLAELLHEEAYWSSHLVSGSGRQNRLYQSVTSCSSSWRKETPSVIVREGSPTPLRAGEIWRRNIRQTYKYTHLTANVPLRAVCSQKRTHAHDEDCTEAFSGHRHPKHNHSSAWPVFERLSPALCATSARLPEAASSTYSPGKTSM